MIVLRKDAKLSLRIQLYCVVYVHLTSIEKQRDHDIGRKHENREQKTSITIGRFGQPFLFSRVYFFSFHDQRFLFPSTCLFVPSFLVVFWDYATQFFIDARFWSRFSSIYFPFSARKTRMLPTSIHKQPSFRFVLRLFVFFLFFPFSDFFSDFFSLCFRDKDYAR